MHGTTHLLLFLMSSAVPACQTPYCFQSLQFVRQEHGAGKVSWSELLHINVFTGVL